MVSIGALLYCVLVVLPGALALATADLAWTGLATRRFAELSATDNPPPICCCAPQAPGRSSAAAPTPP